MAMSRKHHREVAEIIKDELDSLSELTEVEQAAMRATLSQVALKMAGMFRRDNNLFDIGRFMEACGIE